MRAHELGRGLPSGLMLEVGPNHWGCSPGKCPSWWSLPNSGPELKASTFRHLLEVLEDAEVVGQVRGQDDVPHQVQHALVVLRGGREMSRPPARHPHPLPSPGSLYPSAPSPVRGQLPAPPPSLLPRPIHLPGEVVKDVTTMGVEDGDGLSEVVPLRGEE